MSNRTWILGPLVVAGAVLFLPMHSSAGGGAAPACGVWESHSCPSTTPKPTTTTAATTTSSSTTSTSTTIAATTTSSTLPVPTTQITVVTTASAMTTAQPDTSVGSGGMPADTTAPSTTLDPPTNPDPPLAGSGAGLPATGAHTVGWLLTAGILVSVGLAVRWWAARPTAGGDGRSRSA